MSLFSEHCLPAEQILLTSGPAEVRKFAWRFRPWLDLPLKHSYGRKPMVDCEGKPAFAELAIIPVLKQHGFDGAVWVDNYRSCRFRNAMPPAVCELPEQVCDVHRRIEAINGGYGGCWDVLAWGVNSIMFVECKWKDKDRISPKQRQWLESALGAGLRLENFAICEWTLDS